MNWFNFETKNIRKPEFSGSTAAQLGIWQRLVIHCCEHENSGIIIGADLFPDGFWMQLGLTKADVQGDTLLWHWNSIGNLYVHEFPLQQQEKAKLLRKKARSNGRKGGSASSPKKAKAVKDNGQLGGAPKQPLGYFLKGRDSSN